MTCRGWCHFATPRAFPKVSGCSRDQRWCHDLQWRALFTKWSILFECSNSLFWNILNDVFSRMRSKGSRMFPFHSGGLGVEGVFARHSATVRNRLQVSVWGPYGRTHGEFCNRGHFWRFPVSRSFGSRGKRGTSWHSDVFRNVSKVVLWQAQYFCVVLRRCVAWQAQHFGNLHGHFAWQAHHFRRVMLRVFCKSHCQGCVKWRQGANSLAGVAFCEMGWKLMEVLHGTSILRSQFRGS